ncbi:family 1 glycosylhydrolase [Sandarakinorhabdus sp. DWP1-3-1]|uniref:family 1 glycosylhydrolase n=1 Tax=Sandarakinorhabdus sp. DWP1-3-1 TaxID=2804627 RepID=UPI003CF94F5D
MVELWGGLECTVNRIDDCFFDQASRGNRRTEPLDFTPFSRLGIKAIRLPVLWETTAARPEHLEVVDTHMAALQRLGMRPIVGLVHHGSGPAGTDLLDADFATGLAEHAAVVARRYPHVHDWTPVNEPLTTARFSCLYGHWYPHRHDEAALWLALLNQIDATRLAMRSIRAVNPQARLIQTDDLGEASSTPEMAKQRDFENHRRWLTWDLLAGLVVPGHPLWSRIAEHGHANQLQKIAYDPCPADVIGINHYLCSNRYLTHRCDLHPDIVPASDGVPCTNLDAVRTVESTIDLAGLLRQAWHRYGTTLAVTECHNGSTRDEQMRWFYQGWRAASAVASEGIPVEAVTAWSLLGAFDWNSLLTRDDGHYEPGVFDVRSTPPRPTAMAGLLQALAHGADPPLSEIVEAAGWWQRPERMLPSYAASTPAPPLAGRPILIIGATGTLARAIAGQCQVRGLAHLMTDRNLLTLTDPVSVAAALDRFAPWAIINCAGLVDIDRAERDPRLCRQVNAIGPQTLARAATERGIRLVHISSDQVFDGRAGAPYHERDRTRAVNAYGRAKAESERRVRLACPDALIVRTAAFFSPHDPHNFAVHALDTLARGQPFPAAADQIVSPTYVPDLVTTLLDLLIDGENGIWHLASAGGMDWAEFAGALAEASGLQRRLVRRANGGALGQLAPRPADARLTSCRGLVMPALASAIERFSATYRPAASRTAPAN